MFPSDEIFVTANESMNQWIESNLSILRILYFGCYSNSTSQHHTHRALLFIMINTANSFPNCQCPTTHEVRTCVSKLKISTHWLATIHSFILWSCVIFISTKYMANFGIIPTTRTRVQYSSISSIISKSSPHFQILEQKVNAVKFRELNIFCGNQNLKRALTRDVRSNTLKMNGTYSIIHDGMVQYIHVTNRKLASLTKTNEYQPNDRCCCARSKQASEKWFQHIT